MRDGDVFEGDVEFLGALEEVSADAVGNLHVLVSGWEILLVGVVDGDGYLFTLSDELGGIELGYYGL